MHDQESAHAGTPTDTWSDRVFSGALQLIAEGVTEIVGFNLACISVVRTAPDGTEQLEVIAVAGHGYGAEMVIGRRTALASLLKEIEKAEVWGLFRFLPHELLETQEVENTYGWIVPDIEVIDAPDAWHPLDLLVALLYDDHGVLRGTLAIDVPENGRRPGPEQRRMLEKFAVQAGRTVVTTLEREELAEQVRLAETARTIVREANTHHGLDTILADCQQGLLDGFRSQGSWIQTFDGGSDGTIYSSFGTMGVPPEALVRLGAYAARDAWAQQTTIVFVVDHPFPEEIAPADRQAILGFLQPLGVGSVLFVPLGAGTECLGSIALARDLDAAEWTELDRQAALDIGHDLGRVILNARTFQREHELVVELQALDTYKSQLIATVSHELKNPLTAVIGYLEILEADTSLGTSSRSAVEAMERGAGRLSRITEDLLLLSKVGDPNHGILPADVDLKRIVDEVVDLVGVVARQKHLVIDIDQPAEPVTARGDAAEIDRLVANLVSNAVKYTPRGRRVGIKVSHDRDQVRLEVVDEGLGISAADQEHLFDEFFRSSNPEAVRQPGTGLGLAIVKRIVERHDGDIEVVSALGAGSSFTVTLPAAGSAGTE